MWIIVNPLPCPKKKCANCANHQSKAHDVPPWLPSLSPPPCLAPARLPSKTSSSGQLWRRRPNKRCRSAWRAPAVEKWTKTNKLMAGKVGRWQNEWRKKESDINIYWNDMNYEMKIDQHMFCRPWFWVIEKSQNKNWTNNTCNFFSQWPLSSSQVPSKIGNNAISKALFVKISWPNTATVIRSKCCDTSPLDASNNSDHQVVGFFLKADTKLHLYLPYTVIWSGVHFTKWQAVKVEKRILVSKLPSWKAWAIGFREGSSSQLF